MTTTETRVLIVGAGPVGLGLAIELGRRAVPCLLIERNDRVGYAPRAKTTNVRTREHLRRWGIANRLVAASPFGADYPSDVHFVTRLGGHRLATIENAFFCKPGHRQEYAEHAQWIPQYKLEDVLKQHADTLEAVTIRFGAECVSFEQDRDGVTARVRDLASGKDATVTCDYLVGCDGARSLVRTGIGAQMLGQYGLSRNYNIVVRAPGLAALHRHPPGIMYWQVNADGPSFTGPMDVGDKWFFMPTALREGVTFTDREAAAHIAKANGIALDYEVLSSDEWVASQLIADRYRDRRVFLAGDACHLHPPFGGYGMNMGIADSVDIGWKLAAVLQGWGGEQLLESYEAERRPVHRFVIDEAVANHSVLSNQLLKSGLEDDTATGEQTRAAVGQQIQASKLREFRSLAVAIGYRYDSSPVIVDDGSEAFAIDPLNYRPSARPGARAPHLWLDDTTSLYDTFGDGFTLLGLRGSDASGLAVMQDRAGRYGLPLTVVSNDDPALRDLYQAPYALIRPDQHVAWRGDALPTQPYLLFDHITGRRSQAG